MHAPPSWPRGALGRRRDAPLALPTAPHAATRVGQRPSPETPFTPRTARWALSGAGTVYGRRSGLFEALRTPLPSTDALGGLFALRAASQRRVSTTKALAEPLLDRCKPCLGAGVAVLDCCRPLQAPLQPSLVSIPPNTPRFRLFRLQRLHTFLTNPRVHIIYTEFHRDFIQNPIKYVQEVEIHEVSV